MGQSKAQESIVNNRREVARDGEPLFTRTRSVAPRGRSLGHTIPGVARDLIGIGAEDDVVIEVYEDGYFVTVADGDGDE